MELLSRARRFARQAYGPEGDLDHPFEVARLVEATGASDDLIAVAILHDVIEDTGMEPERIVAGFGSRIGALVCTLTEDEQIHGYQRRKADLRARACAAGPDAGLVFVADKLANVRRLQRGEKPFRKRKVAHYQATVDLMRRELPSLPLLDQLERELGALRRAHPAELAAGTG